MESLVSKNFKGVLVINWKNGSMKVNKKKPKSLGPWDIPVNIDIKLNIPENPEITAKGEVDIPGYKVKEMFIKSI